MSFHISISWHGLRCKPVKPVSGRKPFRAISKRVAHRETRVSSEKIPGPRLNIKTVFPAKVISVTKIPRSWDDLIFMMEIPILVRRHHLLRWPPDISKTDTNKTKESKSRRSKTIKQNEFIVTDRILEGPQTQVNRVNASDTNYLRYSIDMKTPIVK